MSNWSEADLEDWASEHPEEFDCSRWIGRQIELPSGRLDLLGLAHSGELCVVELKAVDLTSKDILQCCRCSADIESYAGRSTRRVLVGTGGVSSQLQFEADSVSCELHSVEHTFSISGRWVWNTDAESRHEEKLRAVLGSIDGIRAINAAYSVAKFYLVHGGSIQKNRINAHIKFVDLLDEVAGESEEFDEIRYLLMRSIDNHDC